MANAYISDLPARAALATDELEVQATSAGASAKVTAQSIVDLIGSGVAGQVAIWDGTSSLTGTNDPAVDSLTVGSTPFTLSEPSAGYLVIGDPNNTGVALTLGTDNSINLATGLGGGFTASTGSASLATGNATNFTLFDDGMSVPTATLTAGPFLPSADNAQDLGCLAAYTGSDQRWRTGYFATKVVTPTLDSGAELMTLTAGDFMELTAGTAILVNAPALMGFADNTSDLGGIGATFKTGYFGTSVVSPLLQTTPVALTALGSAATAGTGTRAFINDALVPVFGSAVADSGAVTVPVYSDGTNWVVG